jgi:hypothetical protein
MSFTIMRNKDGKEIPIKVSILDAFRSAPLRRPKAAKLVQMEEKKVDVDSFPSKHCCSDSC